MSGIVLQRCSRLQRRGEVVAEMLPVGPVLVDHPNVVVVLGARLAVENIRFIWRTKGEAGGGPKNTFNVLKKTCVGAIYKAMSVSTYFAVKQVNKGEIPQDLFTDNRPKLGKFLVVGFVIFAVFEVADDGVVEPLRPDDGKGAGTRDETENLQGVRSETY